MEILVFYDIAPQPIKIQIHSVSQNDRLDFSFLKDIYAIAEKWLERGVNRWFMSPKFDAPPSINTEKKVLTTTNWAPRKLASLAD